MDETTPPQAVAGQLLRRASRASLLPGGGIAARAGRCGAQDSDLFWAFVGTGHVADPAKNYAAAYGALLAKAAALGEERAIRELREVGPPPYPNGRGYAVQRRWSNLFEGADVFIAAM